MVWLAKKKMKTHFQIQSKTDRILYMGQKLLESGKMYIIKYSTEFWDHVLFFNVTLLTFDGTFIYSKLLWLRSQ